MKKKNRKWLYISVAVVLGLLLVMKLAGKKDSAEKDENFFTWLINWLW